MRPEEYGFDRFMFPFSHKGHQITLVTNDAHVTREGRLAFHFLLYCPICDDEQAVRGRLPESHSSVERIQTAKLLALGYFNEECGADNQKTYISV